MTVYGIRFQSIPDIADGMEPVWIRLVNPWQGYWLEFFDPDARDGTGEARFTGAEGDALRFSTFDEAKAFWFTQSTVRPMASGLDGVVRENRPLSIVSIVIDELSE